MSDTENLEQTNDVGSGIVPIINKSEDDIDITNDQEEDQEYMEVAEDLMEDNEESGLLTEEEMKGIEKSGIISEEIEEDLDDYLSSDESPAEVSKKIVIKKKKEIEVDDGPINIEETPAIIYNNESDNDRQDGEETSTNEIKDTPTKKTIIEVEIDKGAPEKYIKEEDIIDIESNIDVSNSDLIDGYEFNEDENNESVDIEIISDNNTSEDSERENISRPFKMAKTKATKTLEQINTKIDEITVMKMDDSDMLDFAKQYLDTGNKETMIGSRNIIKNPLPYSGLCLDISSFKNLDLIGIHKRVAGIDYVTQIVEEMKAIYKNVVGNSFHHAMTFEQWSKSILYPDIESLYYGVYCVNNPGINKYPYNCPTCGAENSVEKNNDELANVNFDYESLTQKDIEDTLRETDKNKIESYKEGARLVRRKELLPVQKCIVYEGIPSLYEVLDFITRMKNEGESDDLIQLVFQPLELLYRAAEDEEDAKMLAENRSKALMYKFLLYIKEIHVPLKKSSSGGKVGIKYVNPGDQYKYAILSKLDKEDFKFISSSKNIRKIIRYRGVTYRITDIPKCTADNCEGKVSYIPLDMRDMLFIKAGEVISDQVQ